MLSLVVAASIYSGVLTVKERCHNFDCRVVKRFKNQPCKIDFDGQRAEAFGNAWWMKQFMWGEKAGFHGVNERTTLTMFFVNQGLRSAYIAEYDQASNENYDRWACQFTIKGKMR